MKHCCNITGAEFNIDKEDLELYKKLDVPVPSICPEERMKKRHAFRNEGSVHYRKCDGSTKTILSIYSPDCYFKKVFDNDYWWSDNWSAKDHARDYDFSRPFFQQFKELLCEVPKMARIQQGHSENSRYCNAITDSKNCHLMFSSAFNEDCLYGRVNWNCRNCLDNFALYNSELCYECVQCENCYACIYLENCKGCTDSGFLKNCIGCNNCFGCVNLHNKSYYFFNEKCSKEEYSKKLKQLKLYSRKYFDYFKEQFNEYANSFYVPYYQGYNNEDVSGNYISNSKNAHCCFDVGNLEDCKYCDNLYNAKDCNDVSFYGGGGLNELLYECEGVGNGAFNVSFSKLIWGGSSNICYSYECFSSEDLFACAGLQKAKYCILNKQYSKAEYASLKQRIIAHMKDTGEWGSFFPVELSPFGYNETLAWEYFPITEEEAGSKGYKWKESNIKVSEAGVACEVPDDINDVSEHILNAPLLCKVSGKKFKIEKPELSFYKMMNLPAPLVSPYERHLARIKRRNRRLLHSGKCAKCDVAIQTTYNRKRHDKVLCKDCYLGIVE